MISSRTNFSHAVLFDPSLLVRCMFMIASLFGLVEYEKFANLEASVRGRV